MAMNRRSVTETIRQIVERDPANRDTIAEAAGVSDGNLSRFVRRLAGLNGKSIDAIAEHYGLELVPRPSKKNTIGGKKRSPHWPFQPIE